MIERSDFDRALDIVLHIEGNYSDHPADKGGPTNFGITQATFSAFLDGKQQPHRPVNEITTAEVDEIYLRMYWEPLDCSHMDWPLNLIVFDAGVHHGTAKARTMMASATFGDVSVQMHAYALLAIRTYFYKRNVQLEPGNSVFLRGWLNRVDYLRKEAGL